MTGLFAAKDPQVKEIRDMKKQLRKLVKQKDYDEALKIGKKIISKNSNDYDVLFILGGIYYMKNKYRDAVSYFDKTLKIATFDTEVLTLKANSHYHLGENKQAIQCCNKIREIDPKNKIVTELLSKIESTK